ncbi:MAG: hypothetical protein K2J20_06975, partial [Bacilli bacterium]|nr:hypothetical protein [Bacilli bacterium]
DQNLLLGKANYVYNIATRKGDVCIDNSLSLYCKNFSIEFIESQLLEHCKQRVKVIIEEP